VRILVDPITINTERRQSMPVGGWTKKAVAVGDGTPVNIPYLEFCGGGGGI